MKTSPGTSKGPLQNKGHWDDLNTFERVKMILNNAGHFLFYGLITRQELTRAMSASESGLEYMVENHPDVVFTNINVAKEISAQAHRRELRAAINAALFESGKN